LLIRPTRLRLCLFAIPLLVRVPAAAAATPVGDGGQKAGRIAGASACARLIEQARTLMAQKRYDEAVPLLRQAVSEESRSATAHFYLGAALYHTQALPQAIAEFQSVLGIAPGTAEATFNIAGCYERLRDYDSAITWYEKYLQMGPSGAEAADVRRRIETIKKDREVHQLFKESHQMLESKRAVDARFLLERAAKLQPDSPEIHYNLGMAYHNSGNLPRAIEEFQNALKLKPDMADAMLNIASSYQALGQKQEAIGWFKRYLAANPQAPDHKAVSDMIMSLQNEISKQSGDDPRGPDFYASVTRSGVVRRWPPAKLPIKVFIDSGAGVKGMRESYRQVLIEALDAWMRASQGRLAYELVPSKEQADFLCDWTASPGDVTGEGSESEQGVARIFGRDHGHGVVEIDRATLRVLTVDREKEGAPPVSDEVMKKTCLHETGHALGLMGHSPNSHDVMFFSESPTVWPVLSKRDKATLVRLYEWYPARFSSTTSAVPAGE